MRIERFRSAAGARTHRGSPEGLPVPAVVGTSQLIKLRAMLALPVALTRTTRPAFGRLHICDPRQGCDRFLCRANVAVRAPWAVEESWACVASPAKKRRRSDGRAKSSRAAACPGSARLYPRNAWSLDMTPLVRGFSSRSARKPATASEKSPMSMQMSALLCPG
jgi:hypothetical protein